MRHLSQTLIEDSSDEPAKARDAAMELEIQYLKNLLAGAIQYGRKQEQLASQMRKLALIDELTGLYNRRGFLELAKQHLKLVQRTRRPNLLVFADIDGLKRINDTYGHSAGDQVIRETADVLRKSVRESDIVARLGGDEFVILAREVLNQRETSIADRLRDNLIDHNNQQRTGQFPLSISFGLSSFSYQSLSIKDLLVRADQEMYRQKRACQDFGVIPSSTDSARTETRIPLYVR